MFGISSEKMFILVHLSFNCAIWHADFLVFLEQVGNLLCAQCDAGNITFCNFCCSRCARP